jgi:hypothetical protein
MFSPTLRLLLILASIGFGVHQLTRGNFLAGAGFLTGAALLAWGHVRYGTVWAAFKRLQAGDVRGANQMLDHLEAVLDLRRKRGLFIEERHAAEALALRGHTEAALDALEKAERDRTIYYRWQLVLLHNEIFAGFRNHPRFVALVEKIQRDLSRQREQLQSAKN